MSEPLLHYIYDPLCGWCYAAEPLVNAVDAAGIEIALFGGNLFPEASHLLQTKRQAIRDADRRIGSLTEQPFGEAYLQGLLGDPETIWWSRPTIVAVMAAEAIDPHCGLRMLNAIQNAHYVRGLRVSEPETLAGIAAELALDRDLFVEYQTGVPVDNHVRETRTLMARHGCQGFPSFVLEHEGKFHRIPHETTYGRPEAFLALVREAAR